MRAYSWTVIGIVVATDGDGVALDRRETHVQRASGARTGTSIGNGGRAAERRSA